MTDPVDREWLSPTRAWRLTECAASVGPVTNAPIALENNALNAGTAAHRAIQVWINSNGYEDDDVRRRLSEAIDTVLKDSGGNVVVGEWTSTRARLLARAVQLAALLRRGGRVVSEKELRDSRHKLRGTPDIVVLGQGGASVIDLKTPTTNCNSLPPWINFQLSIYAHLVRQEYGVLPRQTDVFRLNKGLIPAAISKSSVAVALETVQRAREADRSVASPAPETCRYCRRRIECQPHWDAATSWPETDCVEGTIERIERAENGLTALHLQTSAGLQWVSGIPSVLVTAAVGERLRLLRLKRSESVGDLNGFIWRPHSALGVVGASR